MNWKTQKCTSGGELLIRGELSIHPQHMIKIVPSEDAKLMSAAPDMLRILEKILYAHDTKNCGASMGEAVLCKAYAAEAREAINKAKGG